MLLRLLWPLACVVACGDPAAKTDPQAEAWSAQYEAGRAAFTQSDFDEAGAAFNAALTLAEHFGSGDPRYGRTAHQLAQLHVLRRRPCLGLIYPDLVIISAAGEEL